MLFLKSKEAQVVGVRFGVRLANDPERRSCQDGSLGQFKNPLAFGDGGGADEPGGFGFGVLGFGSGEENVFDAVGDDVDFGGVGIEHGYHEMFFPGGQRNKGVGFPVGIPGQLGSESRGQDFL